jgi:hypothetical protein
LWRRRRQCWQQREQMTGDGDGVERAHCSPFYQLHGSRRRDVLEENWFCAMASPLGEAGSERACATPAEVRRTAVPRPGESRTDGREERRATDKEKREEEGREEKKGRGYHEKRKKGVATMFF